MIDSNKSIDSPLNPFKLAESLSEYWSPKVISEVDDAYVKVAKLKGSFVWHQHDNEDELFYILQGSLVMEYKDKQVSLQVGDLHVVPKGILHNPVASVDCLVMLIESKATLHTGGNIQSSGCSIEEQLKSFNSV
ncbi:MAG: cupin [Kangiella sp.]|nr:MAG: cupin [Kangiella sp.]